MVTAVGGIGIDLRADSGTFIRDMERASRAVQTNTAKMRQSMRQVERASRGVEKQIGKVRKSINVMGAAIAAAGLGLLIRDTVRTAAEFQKLQASLKTVTGSAENANRAFGQIKNFAATTPFDLQQVTGAFIKLKALGLNPSEKALRSYGNTASAMSKSLNDFVEAVADAITGEFERLKEFGIRASTEGNKVSFTFQGVTTTIGKNAAEIEGFLQRLGEIQFAGAMEEQARTLGGALSNLGDSISVFQNEVGEGGLADAVADVARELSEATNNSQSFARELGANLGGAVRGLADAAKFAADNIRLISAAITGLIALKVASVFLGMASAVWGYVAAVRAAAIGTGALTAVLALNPIGLLAVAIGAAAGALVLLSGDTERARAAQGDYNEAIERTNDALGTSLTASKEIREARIREAIATNEAAIAAESLVRARQSEALERLQRQQQAVNSFSGEGEVAQRVLRGAARLPGQDDLDKNIARATAGLAEFDGRIATLRGNIEKLNRGLTETASATTETADAASDAGIQFSKATNELEKEVSALQLRVLAQRRGSEALAEFNEQQAIAAAITKAGIDLSKKLTVSQAQEVSHIGDLIRLKQRLTREERQLQRIQKQADNLGELKEEIRLLNVSERERTVRLAVFRKENELRREGIELTSELAQKELELVRQTAELGHQLEKAASARELFIEPFKNAIGEIQSAFSGLFESIFSGGVNSFSDLASTIKRVFIKLAAEIAAALVFKPVLGSVLGAVGLEGLGATLTGSPTLGSAGGGGSSILNSLSNLPSLSSLFGDDFIADIDAFGARLGFTDPAVVQGALLSGPVPGGSVGALSGASLSGILGAAGIGAFGGGLLAQLTGGNQVGGSIGGGLGAAGGFAIGGPIGAAIGGLGGSLLGGLFGGSGSSSVGPNGNTGIIGTINPNNIKPGDRSRLMLDITGADNGADPNVTINIARQVVDSLNALADALDLQLTHLPLNPSGFIRQGNGTSLGFASGEAFANALFNAGGIFSLDPQMQKLIDASSSLQQFTQLAGGIGNTRENAFAVSASIVDFLKAQSLSPTSTLSPAERLVESQRQFEDLLGRVRGGELGLTGALQQSAHTLIGFGRQNFASTVDFANIEKFVRSSLLNLSENFLSDDFIDRQIDAQIDAITQQTEVIAEGDAQVVDAVELLRREIQLLRQELAA